MSFRLFIYYCAICGGWAALVGWGLGRLIVQGAGVDPDNSEFLFDLLMGVCLGGLIAFGVGLADAMGNAGGRPSQVLLRATVRGLAAGVLGLSAGAGGAAIGSALNEVSEWLKVLGWVVVGLMIGGTVGGIEVVERRRRGEPAGGAGRKLVNGLIGGAAGGFLGSVLFLAARFLLSAGLHRPPHELFSASAWGFVALGACIGLMIGMAQVILKEAWIKVEAGFRPGRELILNKEETTVGRGEGCDVALFGDAGVEKLHARIVHRKNRYFVEDADTPGGTFVNDQRADGPVALRDGDEIRVGKSVLRFGERAKRK